jgi:hypothetical protein
MRRMKPIRNQGPGSDYAECIYIYIYIYSFQLKANICLRERLGTGCGSVLKNLNFFFIKI